MLRGGISDKIGNFYEADWAVIEALSVLQGEADEIRIEAFNEDARGFEFCVRKGATEIWHQCKRRASGSWTIAALEREGVLSDFGRKLDRKTTECVFVSTETATQLKSVSNKAHLVQSAEDFSSSLSKSDQGDVEELSRIWGSTPYDLWDKLRRCRFETVSEHSLKRQASQLSRLLFAIEPEHAVARLLSYLSNHLTHRLTTVALREAVASMALGWRAMLDPTLDEKLSRATDDYLASLLPPVGGGMFVTPDLEQAVEAAFKDSTTGLLIAGGAGSGKSAVLSEIVREARQRGWPVLALRIDRFLTATRVEEIGETLTGRTENPAGIFGNRHGLRQCLFVVDQVDAVSEASGRSGRIRDELFQMLRDAWVYPGMRVVIACRSYDLEHDSRLRAISESSSVKNIVLRPLGWDEAVTPIMMRLGVSRDFSENERRILSVPINLRLFAEIVAAGGTVDQTVSGSRLFDQLLQIRESELRLAGTTWTASAALGEIASYMSTQQDLTAPEQVVAAYPNARNILASMGFVLGIPGRLQFAHESFFDHIFSSSFVSTGASVRELLAGDQQRLFRRTQVRQIFARLREQAPPRAYIRNLREVLESSQVRYLVKDAVAAWLSSVPAPTQAEAKIAFELFKSGGNDRTLAKVVLSGPAWLPVLTARPEVAEWLEAGDDHRALVLSALRQGATVYPDQAESFLRSWWAGSEERLVQIVEWFAALFPDAPIGRLEQLYKDLIADYPIERLREEGISKHLQLGSWVHGKQSALAAHVFGYWLNKWTRSFPEVSPFDRSDDSNRTYWLKELAKSDPKEFLEAILGPLVTAIEREREAIKSGERSWATIRVPFSEHDNVHVRLVAEAISAISASSPEFCEKLLELVPLEGDVPTYLHLRAIAANGLAFGSSLVQLMQRTNTMDIGEHGGEWQAFAQAARAAIPFLSEADRGQIERSILDYRPELERAKRALPEWSASPHDSQHRKYILSCLRRSGETERAILQTISPELLTEATRLRLEELNRKFGGAPLPEAHGIRGGWVQSPIQRDRAGRMTDGQWLSAMEKYSGNEGHRYFEDHVVGGASQLAGELREQTKSDPARFVRLLEQMPLATNAEYAEAILSGLRDTNASQVAAKAIRAATKWGAMRTTVNWVVHSHPEAGTAPDILDRVIDCALNGSASDTLITSSDPSTGRTETVQDLLRGDDDLGGSGLNSERGSAHHALANVLWQHPETLHRITSTIEKCILNEPLPSVRMMIFHGINSIGKYDPPRAAKLARDLGLKDPRALLDHGGRHVLRWAIWRAAFELDEFLRLLKSHEYSSVRCLAHVLEGSLALHDDSRSENFVAAFAGDSLVRRVAAYLASGNLGPDIVGDRAELWLSSLLDDPSTEVRQELRTVEWDKVLDELSPRCSLALAFIASRSFEEESDSFMRRMGERVDHFPAVARAAVARVLLLMDSWTGTGRNGHWSTLHELGRTLVALYRTVDGDTEEEEKLLDLFDLYLARDPSSVRAELSSYERH